MYVIGVKTLWAYPVLFSVFITSFFVVFKKIENIQFRHVRYRLYACNGAQTARIISIQPKMDLHEILSDNFDFDIVWFILKATLCLRVKMNIYASL
jgi:hypothetical protein